MQSSIHGERRVSEESENPTELIPDIEEAKFFTLGAQLLVIGGLANQDLRFKTFYDLTGSGGQAGMAAALLQEWSAVRCLESSAVKYEIAVLARRIVNRLDLPDLGTNIAAWKIEHTTFKRADWAGREAHGWRCLHFMAFQHYSAQY
ncbi:unnamed protein product [Sphacelaria rigidula]